VAIAAEITASFIDTGECKKAKGKVRMRGKNSKSSPQLGNLCKLASKVYAFVPPLFETKNLTTKTLS
jgi:hypothetical protein